MGLSASRVRDELLLAKKHGLDPVRSLCVGDRPIDIAAARDAHMPAALLVRLGISVTLPDDAPALSWRA